MCQINLNLYCFLIADDTNILYSSENYEFVENTVNDELDKVNQWLCTNRLSKTDSINF